MKLLRLLLVLAALFAAVCVAIYHFFGLLGVVGAFLGGVIFVKLALGFAMKKMQAFGMGLFKAKSAVLSGATVAVNSITSAAPPQEECDEQAGEDQGEETPKKPTNFYFLDITITPQTAADACTTFGMWEPGELILAPAGAQSGLPPEETDGEQSPGEIYSIEPWQNGAFVQDDDCKYEGEQRLRLHVGLHEPVETINLRYYFELLGPITMPQAPR